MEKRNSDSIKLLKVCNKGCNTAIRSFIELLQHVDDVEIRKIIDKSTEQHKVYEEKSQELLNLIGESDEKPGKIMKTMIGFNTTLKMDMTSEKKEQKALEILKKGCDMGIQTLTEKMYALKEADHESKDIAKNIIHIEKELYSEVSKKLTNLAS